MHVDLTYPDPSDRRFDVLMEQTEYLAGVLWSDREHRLDKDPSRDVSAEIDRYGTETKAFWRGVIEVAGRLNDYVNGEYSYPRIELEGSYSFLMKFVDFLKEEMERAGWAIYWVEADRKLRFAASGGKLRIDGVRAQYAVRILYMGAVVARDSFRQRVEKILLWRPKR